MIFIDVEKDGVLGYLDWEKFDFGNANWATRERQMAAGLQRDAIFLKSFIGHLSLFPTPAQLGDHSPSLI